MVGGKRICPICKKGYKSEYWYKKHLSNHNNKHKLKNYTEWGFGIFYIMCIGFWMYLIFYPFYIPKYQHLMNSKPGDKNDDLVSFVDFAPSVLNLAGVRIPDYMQGFSFFGDKINSPREYIFGARSRADDMYEMSRAVMNNEFIYIRHYMPHLPYIQPGFIFSDEKWSFRELRKMHQAGTLPPESEEMWNRKPAEELYDLRDDPHEWNNVIDDSLYTDEKTRLRKIADRFLQQD